MKYINELEFLKEWCIMINDYISKLSIHKSLYDQAKNNIIEAYENKNLRGLRVVFNDYINWANGLGTKEIDRLNKILYEKFGENLTDVNIKNIKKIERIIKKGKIINDIEFELIMERVNDICSIEQKQEEVKILNKLLLEYEKG